MSEKDGAYIPRLELERSETTRAPAPGLKGGQRGRGGGGVQWLVGEGGKRGCDSTARSDCTSRPNWGTAVARETLARRTGALHWNATVMIGR